MEDPTYVVNGAKVKCTMGTVAVPLRTTPGRRVKVHGKDKANIMDFKPMINVGPFGVCKTTHLPCFPVCTVWMKGKTDVLVEGFPALLDSSLMFCLCGGTLKLENDGQ